MVFVTAGMGGGTGTGAAPVVRAMRKEARHPHRWRRHQALPVRRRAPHARRRSGHRASCTRWSIRCSIIPNQNLFRVANEKTTFADAFAMADQVLYSGVACITDLMVKEGLINLDFADVRAVMREMGKAMMGTGEASGEKRALSAAEAAISNPLIDDASMKGARVCSSPSRAARTSPFMRSMKPLPASARKSIRTPTSSSAPPSTRRSMASSGSQSLPPASTRPHCRRGRHGPGSTHCRANAEAARRPDPRRPAARTRTDRGERKDNRSAEPAQYAIPTSAPQQTAETIENAAKAAVARPSLPLIEDVTIRPIPPKPSLFPEQSAQPRASRRRRAFIPPAPERTSSKPRAHAGYRRIAAAGASRIARPTR